MWVHGRSRPAGARICIHCVAACKWTLLVVMQLIMVVHVVHGSAWHLLRHLRVGAGGSLRPPRAPGLRPSPCASSSSGEERGGCPSPHFLNGPSEAQLAQFDETKYKILSATIRAPF